MQPGSTIMAACSTVGEATKSIVCEELRFPLSTHQFDWDQTIVGGELVVAGGNTPAMLDVVEEPLNEVTSPVEAAAEADGILTILLRGNVGPRSLPVDQGPDPVGVVAAIRQDHRLRAQSGQKHWTEPVVMSFAGSKAKAHG